MPLKFVLYDSLKALAIGEKLVKFGDSKLSLSYYLPGSPLVFTVAEIMISEEWIVKIENDCDGITHWVLSENGYRIYREGLIWYKSLSFYKKILCRLGFSI